MRIAKRDQRHALNCSPSRSVFARRHCDSKRVVRPPFLSRFSRPERPPSATAKKQRPPPLFQDDDGECSGSHVTLASGLTALCLALFLLLIRSTSRWERAIFEVAGRFINRGQRHALNYFGAIFGRHGSPWHLSGMVYGYTNEPMQPCCCRGGESRDRP